MINLAIHISDHSGCLGRITRDFKTVGYAALPTFSRWNEDSLYVLKKSVAVPGDMQSIYGDTILVFRPIVDRKPEDTIIVCGGDPDVSGKILKLERAGFRVSNATLRELTRPYKEEKDVYLMFDVESLGFFTRLLRPKVSVFNSPRVSRGDWRKSFGNRPEIDDDLFENDDELLLFVLELFSDDGVYRGHDYHPNMVPDTHPNETDDEHVDMHTPEAESWEQEEIAPLIIDLETIAVNHHESEKLSGLPDAQGDGARLDDASSENSTEY